jgi:uncharacterized protein (DUF3820 family)
VPPEPEWLIEGQHEETAFILSLREPEPDMSTALIRSSEAVDTTTGEVIALPVQYDARQYLQSLNADHQHSLMAAYDAACRSLIGPNDVQKEGGREFKKKSAWRKLARHFGISVTTDPTAAHIVHYPGGEWVAYAHATAIAPWGQRYDDVGACGSDEESGRREITYADAIATAQTRAANRATSNLIAMGEVSADELSERKGSTGRPPQSSGNAPRPAGGKVMPFGKNKGRAIADLDTPTLTEQVAWCRKTDAVKFKDLIETLELELDSRRDAVTDAELADESTLPF